MTWLRSTGLRLVLAVGLGVTLWVFVSYSVNPDRHIPFDNIPVNIEGLSPGLLVVDKEGLRAAPPPIDVTVEADADTLESVRTSDLHAFVDLQGRGPGEHAVPVNVRPRAPVSGGSVSQLSPSCCRSGSSRRSPGRCR